MMNKNIQEECFISLEADSENAQKQESKTKEISHQLSSSSFPLANQLYPQTRPITWEPRILITEPDRFLLPSFLDQVCFEVSTKEYRNEVNVVKEKQKGRLVNKDRMGLGEYLKKGEFNQVYCKYGKEEDRKGIDQTMRLVGMSQLSDYNSKQFKELKNCESKKVEKDRIDSNIQSGNLSYAYTNVNNLDAYYLLIEQDTNTHGYTNWFFFRFRNVGVGRRKFYVLNLGKNVWFFRQGMKVSIFSMKGSKVDVGEGTQRERWKKGGEGINFYMTDFAKNEERDEKYYCLYFEYDFQNENDEVFFAMSQPYTYTRLANFMKGLELQPRGQKIYHRIETIGYTISNNIIPAITLMSSQGGQTPKKTIVILGRQHPAQMAGSFICQYMIKILRQQSQLSLNLLSKFNMVFIPMLNPDGVIYGNSRSNLAGYDLNRHWGCDAIKELTPETCKIRGYLSALQKTSEIKFLLDIHGHGKKLNSFLFCCRKQDRVSNRIFPLLMSRMEERFDINSCTYGITRDKEKTIRAQLNEIGIVDSYTLQNSYYGYMNRDKQIIVYNEKDYWEISRSTIKSIYIYLYNREEGINIQQAYGYSVDNIRQQLQKHVQRDFRDHRDDKGQRDDRDIMSESQPDAYGLELEERLKICSCNRILHNKIRESYKVSKVEQQKQDRKAAVSRSRRVVQQERVNKKREVKREIKMTPNANKTKSKKLIEKGIKKEIKNRKKSSNEIRENNEKFENKIINKTFSMFERNICTPKKLSNNFLDKKAKSFDKGSLKSGQKREKIRIFTEQEIDEQNVRRKGREQQFNRIKNESLKNMMKQSLLFVGVPIRNRKCRWVEDRKQRNKTSYNMMDTKNVLLGNEIDDGFDLRWSYKSPLLEKKDKIFPANVSQSVKGESEGKIRIRRKSSNTFQNNTKKMIWVNK